MTWPLAPTISTSENAISPGRARRRALLDFTSRAGKGEALASIPAIARAVAELAGSAVAGTVLDPFCGTGSFLWAVMDRALQLQALVEFVGVELNERLAGLARAIGQTAPMVTTIENGDAFLTNLPMADLVLAAPPVGVRLPEPHVLLNGSTTAHITVAAVDLALRRLRPGGRAVLHVGAGFTFQRAAERYREYLASEHRVAALIGLPGGAIPGTSVRSILIVIDRAEPGETFVAQLGEDWETQLAPGGAAMTAAMAHIDGDSNGR
ncbi:HsdM family class I SAM-dependent methyltransferase [Actinomadura monticuli]|uniref:N-6 DNA methylase n=1 Tax=Actinomadura monticuli TaxID=3097367 RepID=A0ABV4QGM8_9ACTN